MPDFQSECSLQNFYNADDPPLSPQTVLLLTQYSHIPPDSLVKHIRDVRDRAWQHFAYPCIGRYNFLDFSIASAPRYQDILARLTHHNATLLDLGCCFGQDIRKLVFDGVPSTRLTATELEPGFVDLGYLLFHDAATLRTRFITGDFFAPDGCPDLPTAAFDYVHAASFFHLFGWDEQRDAIARALALLKPIPGSTLFGRQTAERDARLVQHASARSGHLFRHNDASFRTLIDEVAARTGISLLAHVELFEKESGWLFMNFSITLR